MLKIFDSNVSHCRFHRCLLRWTGIVVLPLLMSAGVRAQRGEISQGEASQFPTIDRVREFCRLAEGTRWGPLAPVLRGAALKAYAEDKIPVASAWMNVCRWATLLAQTDAEFLPHWISAVDAARVGHPNMSARYQAANEPLSRLITPGLQTWLITNAAFSDEFFGVLAPVDYLPKVLEILNILHAHDPVRFARYPSLALAIAVVYDVPPPPWWPHAQVSPEVLTRRLPSPLDAFNWFTKQDIAGRFYHRLTRLDAAELKFVVDVCAPFEELEWSQKKVDVTLAHLSRAYTMVRYIPARLKNDHLIWPGTNYTLPSILRDGGICTDQAYFATQAGKARGVPTLLFTGTGNDERHAWFGFLDGSQKWQFDAGRYAEQRFVTGLAIDPQTWRQISDHELKFIAEGFRTFPTFRNSQIHTTFAADFLHHGNPNSASKAARRAVTSERRNLAAWELLLAADDAVARGVATREATLREAAIAFQLYPDLEAGLINRLSASLRARGQTSASDFEERRIAQKNHAGRTDLTVQQAREILLRSIATDPLAGRIRTYNSLVDGMGRGAGIGFYDQVVVVAVEHLSSEGKYKEALQAARRAQHNLKVEPGSQFEKDLARLLDGLRGK